MSGKKLSLSLFGIAALCLSEVGSAGLVTQPVVTYRFVVNAECLNTAARNRISCLKNNPREEEGCETNTVAAINKCVSSSTDALMNQLPRRHQAPMGPKIRTAKKGYDTNVENARRAWSLTQCAIGFAVGEKCRDGANKTYADKANEEMQKFVSAINAELKNLR